jgi:hypothetical protein
MNDNAIPAEDSVAAFVQAVVDVGCAHCRDRITAGEGAVQVLGIPGLFCLACGTAALRLRTSSDESTGTEDTGDVDIVEALYQEYYLRVIMGWPTPPAILVVDPEEGPVWRVGVAEDADTTCLGRGRLAGDRLEVTAYRPFPPANIE